MKKTVRISLIVATTLVILGSIIVIIAAASAEWDFTKLETANSQTSSYEITDDFSDILIKTDTADIVFLPSYDDKCKVVCYEKNKEKHSVSVLSGKLTVEIVDTRKWYDYIGINFTSPRITVYLPKAEYSSLKIENSTGDIEISPDFFFENVDISLSTGDIKCNASVAEDIKIETSTGDVCLDRVCCKNLIASTSTGDISLRSVIAEEKILLETDTGDIELEASDAGEIFLQTSTGDVEGTLLSDKVFITETDTGSVDVPRTITGGRCEITTDTGDISIEIKR